MPAEVDQLNVTGRGFECERLTLNVSGLGCEHRPRV